MSQSGKLVLTFKPVREGAKDPDTVREMLRLFAREYCGWAIVSEFKEGISAKELAEMEADAKRQSKVK